MCLRLKPPLIPASPTSPRLFAKHKTGDEEELDDEKSSHETNCHNGRNMNWIFISSNFKRCEKSWQASRPKKFLCRVKRWFYNKKAFLPSILFVILWTIQKNDFLCRSQKNLSDFASLYGGVKIMEINTFIAVITVKYWHLCGIINCLTGSIKAIFQSFFLIPFFKFCIVK